MPDQSEQQRRLGQDPEQFPIHTLEELQAVTRDLLSQARLNVDIMTRDLDRRIYDDDDCLAAIRAIAVRHRKARIRILARELDTPIRHDHRLIELARRLSSFIEIRRLGEDHKDYNEAFLLADGTGVIHRSQANRFEGWASYHQPLKARELQKMFDEAWAQAIVDPNMRRLHI